MGGTIKQIGIVPEQILRAITMMHIEIHHRHALDPVCIARMTGRNCGIVKQAEPHRAVIFRMVTGRAHANKRIAFVPSHHRIHRHTCPTHRTKGGIP